MKEKFDFNKCISLYKENTNQWREYLYKNFNVFIRHSWVEIEYEYYDIFNWAFMRADELILKSIEKDYTAQQIYSFLQMSINWYVINYLKYDACGIWNYTIQEDCEVWLDRSDFKSIKDCNTIDFNGIEISHIKELILQLPYENQQIILLRHFTDYPYKFSSIAEYIGVRVDTCIRRYQRGITMLQKALDINKNDNVQKSEIIQG